MNRTWINRSRVSRLAVILLFILMQQALFGCTSNTTGQAQDLIKYSTKTPPPTATQVALATNTAQPTPTPQVYNVAQNDTLTGIAKKFGITMEALALANPQVLPSSLSVGQQLVIPAEGQLARLVVLTPSPNLSVSEPACHAQPDGVLCVAMVKNNSTSAQSDILVRFDFFGPSGDQVSSHDGVLVLNHLPANTSLPAYVFIPGQQRPASVTATVVSGYAKGESDASNTLALNDVIKNIGWDGKFATIQAVLASGKSEISGGVWVAAIAKDANGKLAGFRRWEWTGDVFPAGGLPVELAISAFGPPITAIEVYVEELGTGTP